MKEYCLVPRNKVGMTPSTPPKKELKKRKYIHRPSSKNRSADGIPTPKKEKQKISGGRRFKSKGKKIYIYTQAANKDPLPPPIKIADAKPDLSILVDKGFDLNYQPYAKGVLNYFKNNSNIIWDEMGYLQSPFQGYNIITMIHKLTDSKGYLDSEDIPFYKMLISMGNIPLDVIMNVDVKKQLRGIARPTKKKGGGGRNTWSS